jgi:hypothetical protein
LGPRWSGVPSIRDRIEALRVKIGHRDAVPRTLQLFDDDVLHRGAEAARLVMGVNQKDVHFE